MQGTLIMMFRTIALLMVFGLYLQASIAEARDSTRNYSCSGVKQLIALRGAVVLNTKNQHVYRRFVASRAYCQPDEITKIYSAPTRSGRCRLRICVFYEPFFD